MIMSLHEKYIKRCFTLARKAAKHTKSNPMVGAVLVYEDRVIGEGYHEFYGGHHAEVNAIKSVKKANQHLIQDATLYVSLEPCCIERKTPACTNLILKHKIKKVFISALDPNPDVAGKGVKILTSAGCVVEVGILKKEGEILIRKFESNLKKKPYVILKFAQSDDRFIGQENETIAISNEYTKVLVHKWRSEVDGILVGYKTALVDNPRLTTREYNGENPIRIAIDRNASLPKSHHLWSDENESWFLSNVDSDLETNKKIINTSYDPFDWKIVLSNLYDSGIYSILIEGGAKTINSLIKSDLWDEARVITSPLKLNEGIKAPVITGRLMDTINLKEDTIHIVFANMNVN